MKQLSESATNILNRAIAIKEEQPMQALGSIQRGGGAGLMIMPLPRENPFSAQELRMCALQIASMQQVGKLTVYSEKIERKVPRKDYDGNIIGWEFDLVEGKSQIQISPEIGEDDIKSLEIAVTPAHKMGIQNAIERLAQIKPIGKSELRQSVNISSLVFDLITAGASELAVNEVCTEARKSKDSPFFPEYAVFLDMVETKMELYRQAYSLALNKDALRIEDHSAPKDPIENSSIWGKSWGELTESQQQQMLNRGKK